MCKNCKARQKLIRNIFAPGQIDFIAWTALRGLIEFHGQMIEGEADEEAMQAEGEAIDALAHTANAMNPYGHKLLLKEAEKVGLDLRIPCTIKETKKKKSKPKPKAEIFESNVLLNKETLRQIH